MSAAGQAQTVHQPVPNLAPGTGLVILTPTHSVEYPTIAAWLAYCDKHPGRSGEDLSELLPNFQKEGFRHIHQLTGDRITVEKLAEWVGIGRGTADLLIRYADIRKCLLVKLSIILKKFSEIFRNFVYLQFFQIRSVPKKLPSIFGFFLTIMQIILIFI